MYVMKSFPQLVPRNNQCVRTVFLILCQYYASYALHSPSCHNRQVYPQVYPHTWKLKKTLQNMYTRNVLCGILSFNGLASAGEGVCRIILTILENYWREAHMPPIPQTRFIEKFLDAVYHAYVWGMYGGHFFCRVANLSALGIIEDSCLEVHAA